jgi:hypothetical protein
MTCKKGGGFGLLKDHFIAHIPDCPNNSANAHTNLSNIILSNAAQPITKNISDISWRG